MRGGDRIPVARAQELALRHGYEQVVIYARRVGEPGLEWVTTYGVNRAHCAAAAGIGEVLRDGVVPELERLETEIARLRGELGALRCGSDPA